jgi:hypothetical protein
MEIVQTNENSFLEDRNMGLVGQVMDRVEMRRIAELRETYVTISLEDVVRKIAVKEKNQMVVGVTDDDVVRMESLILRMVFIPFLFFFICYLVSPSLISALETHI